MELRKRRIIDGHVHYPHYSYGVSLMPMLAEAGINQLAVVSTPDENRLSLLPDALHLKGLYPNKVYVFGNLDISPLYLAPDIAGETFAHYVDVLSEMGVDGIKMIEGKPGIRKRIPIPDFDSPTYALYWKKMAYTQTPLIFHVNDPEEFWDPERIPNWARQMGWYYGDGTFVDYEDQYRQVLNVLDRYPILNVTFAHFFFLSNQLDRLGEYFERYPNMRVDLVPGIEMYLNFSKDPERVRDFFIKYQDRILYGTDIGVQALLADPKAGIQEEESLARIEVVRGFLENDGPFTLDHEGFLFGEREVVFQGIDLPDAVLDKIYYQNFKNFVGGEPKTLDFGAIIEECQRLEMMINAMDQIQPGMKGDTSSVTMAKAFFTG
jgi:predicted TIM-barrel fold metal-dependent hydrolase